jgi:hypothetical protein
MISASTSEIENASCIPGRGKGGSYHAYVQRIHLQDARPTGNPWKNLPSAGRPGSEHFSLPVVLSRRRREPSSPGHRQSHDHQVSPGKPGPGHHRGRCSSSETPTPAGRVGASRFTSRRSQHQHQLHLLRGRARNECAAGNFWRRGCRPGRTHSGEGRGGRCGNINPRTNFVADKRERLRAAPVLLARTNLTASASALCRK